MLGFRFFPVISFVCILFGGVISGCKTEPPINDRREANPPSWYRGLKNRQGVNLPHLPGELSDSFIDHPNFQRNFTEMRWNTFRLPISWSGYQASGLSITQIHTQIDELIQKLKQIHQAQNSTEPFLLILDFHQYKFGPACGGDGVPSGVIDESGLDSADKNCIFYAFEKFWNNENLVQDRWIQFATEVLQPASTWVSDHQSWLTIGIEPMNEPFAGSSEAVVVSDTLQSVLKLNQYLQTTQPPQVSSRLVPFYEKFLQKLKNISGFKMVSDRAVFVFDPFLLDLFEVAVPGLDFINIKADSDYASAFRLKTALGSDFNLRWIASPHHYLGSYDLSFRSFFPSDLQSVIDRYPNSLFDRSKTLKRFQSIRDKMRVAGMDYFLGEYGTYTRLEGYLDWVRDLRSVIADTDGLGHVWWRYYPDSNADQTGYYLLRSGWELQELKCEEPMSIVRAVFDRCVSY